MRTRVLILLVAVVVAGLVVVAPASAGGDADGGPSPSFTAPETGIGLDQGVFVNGAVVVPLDGGEERVMSEYDAAVFMQSWIATGFYGGADVIKPLPPGLPVHRIDFDGTWVGNPGNVSAYFATDGTTPYVSFPGFAVWTDPAGIPEPTEWFTPPARVIDAFNGDAELIETGGVSLATSVPPDPEDAAGSLSGGSSDDSDPPWVWVAAGVGLVAALAGAVALRRRGARTPDEPA